MARINLTEPEGVDPLRVDVADAPPKPGRRKVAPAPPWVGSWAEKAEARMRRRYPSPGVLLEPNGSGGHKATSPHDNERAWELQIHDAFGTRSQSLVRTFMRQLRDLCGQGWDDQAQSWRPNETQLNAALAFVSGIRPRNEVEAALAAQMLAIHFMTMRVATEALKYGLVDARTASAAAKLARTYAAQVSALERSRGKGSTTRQKIVVRHEKHVHTHQHVHIEQGVPGNGAQPHTAQGKHGVRKPVEQGAEVAPGSPALPSADASGSVVPLPRRRG